jgi:archaellum component FlaC
MEEEKLLLNDITVEKITRAEYFNTFTDDEKRIYSIHNIETLIESIDKIDSNIKKLQKDRKEFKTVLDFYKTGTFKDF